MCVANNPRVILNIGIRPLKKSFDSNVAFSGPGRNQSLNDTCSLLPDVSSLCWNHVMFYLPQVTCHTNVLYLIWSARCGAFINSNGDSKWMDPHFWYDRNWDFPEDIRIIQSKYGSQTVLNYVLKDFFRFKRIVICFVLELFSDCWIYPLIKQLIINVYYYRLPFALRKCL